MPLSKYDHVFGGKGAAEKALRDMKRRYGRKDGEHVFYARIAKAKRKSKPSLAQRFLK